MTVAGTFKILISKNILSLFARNSTSATTSQLPSSVISPITKFPEAPDPLSCCGSGCANCVWIQYANELSDYFNKKGDHITDNNLDKYKVIKDEMEKNIEDENLKAYLLMEIKSKFAKIK